MFELFQFAKLLIKNRQHVIKSFSWPVLSSIALLYFFHGIGSLRIILIFINLYLIFFVILQTEKSN